MSNPSILIVAGEASGDLHGASLVQRLLKQDPTLYLFGMGGSEMEKQGFRCVGHSSDISVTGIFEVIFKLKKIILVFLNLLEVIDEQRPTLAILIDYPDFNLRLAKRLFKRRIPIIYYISPQVWAWRKSRVKLIKKWVNEMLVVFPFEVDFYRRSGVAAHFVGHPLIECHPEGKPTRGEARRIPSNDKSKIIALVPGSRKNEIHYLLEPMLDAAKLIYVKDPRVSFVLPLASTLNRKDIEPKVLESKLPIQIVEGKFYESIESCDVSITCSGTATLETAILVKPMVIVYRLNWISYWIGRLLIHGVQFFGMPNILLGRKVVPELLQSEVTGENIATEVQRFLQDPAFYQTTTQALLSIREKLGSLNASEEVAKRVFSYLDKVKDTTDESEVGGSCQPRIHLWPILWLSSQFYGLGISIRAWLYQCGFFKQCRLPAQVISIGNISVGGTGKTPLTMVLAQKLQSEGKRVAILSRGYKRKSSQAWACVTDGNQIFLTAEEAGDEPYLMAQKLKKVPIYVGKNRYQMGCEVLKTRPIDVFLLDDGFQYWELKRDLDLVLVDALAFNEHEALLPFGNLRESYDSLRRAHHVILTRANQVTDQRKKQMATFLNHIHPKATLTYADIIAQKFRNLRSNRESHLNDLMGKKIYGFCGIGNPDSFQKLLKDLDLTLVYFKIFSDHFPYAMKNFTSLIEESQSHHADCLVTTEKDAVRLSQFDLSSIPVPIYCVDLEFKLEFPLSQLKEFERL